MSGFNFNNATNNPTAAGLLSRFSGKNTVESLYDTKDWSEFGLKAFRTEGNPVERTNFLT